MNVIETPMLSDERIAGLLHSLIGASDGFANHIIWRSELQQLLAEVARYRREDTNR